MELAIQVMRESVAEPRPDGKASPKVGAVLVKPDGTTETACRGELRHGDHAEFTLLERKNRGNKLDGSTLYATLEPCAPGARRDPKIDCAERIRLARIKEVWVGIQDTDPKVARKGIEHLQRHGIAVHMFDRDLQDIIEKENKEFLKQANERAAEAKKKTEEIVLSPLEGKLAASKIVDFSNEALEKYRQRAGIADAVGTSEFNRRLVQLGAVVEQRGSLSPTGFGILLFGREPRAAMRQAGLLARIQYPDGTNERREFDDAAVMIPDKLEDWLRDKLPNVFDRDGMGRRERPALPFEMVREAVVNALIHRDYSIQGAKCQIIVTADTITVRSPGGPPPPITIDQLKSFTAPMLSRNPELHFVFARTGMAEEQGFGLASLRDGASTRGLPRPQYVWDDPYLVLILYRTQQAATTTLAPDIIDSLSKPERKGWEWLVVRGRTNSQRYAAAIDVDIRTARRHLSRFVKLELVAPSGAGPSREYVVK